MYIKELTIEEFNNYSINHPLYSFYQSQNYALVMSETGYEYEFIGYIDDDKIVAAALVLYKSINGINYGYSPKGFLIDYHNNFLLKKFTNDLIEYYYEKEFAFIKINPNVHIGLVNKNFEIINNENLIIKEHMKSSGYLKLKDNLYFESMLPRFGPMIDLTTYTPSDLTKNTRNKIKKSIRKGLKFEKVGIESISYLDTLIHSKNFFYNDLYNTFSKTDEADLFLVYIDKLTYLENSQKFYLNESEHNQFLNDKMIRVSHSKNINKKMNSDMALLAYKKDIMEANKLVEVEDKIIVGAALVVNSNKQVEIIASGYDKDYKRFAPNYFLHYSIIKYYKKISNTLNINGISGNFSSESQFYGLNKFKFGFAPRVYENIGEYDLIINEKAYKYLLRNHLIQKEFSKKL